MACCSPEGTCHCGAETVLTIDTARPQEASVNTVVYSVTGMTCGHCEAAVTEEVSALDGVTGVTVDLAKGLVTVDSKQPLDDDTVRAAVDEAGYELVGRA